MRIRPIRQLLLLLTPIGLASAQTFRGRVLQPDSATQAAGIVVIAIDPAGREVSRAISGSNGGFTLPLPSAGTYAVRAMRIGYRPTNLAPVSVADREVRAIVVVLRGNAIALEAVHVRGNTVCRIRQDSGSTLASLWDQARTALTATQLRTDGAPFLSTSLVYQRSVDRVSRIVQSEASSMEQGESPHVFQSLPADSLAKVGYVTDADNALTYYAPDADVLLSESFASLHCFHTEPPAANRPGWIGIAFTPAVGRSKLSDVEGTLWLDRESSELRQLDFRYTNLPWASGPDDASGQVEFLKVATGDWIISRWVIQMPVAARQLSAQGITRLVPIAMQEKGAEVLAAGRGDVVLRRTHGTALEVRVTARDSSLSPAGTRIELRGTQYAAKADTGGIARFEHVLPGRYTAEILSPAMVWLMNEPMLGDVEVRADGPVSVASVILPTVACEASQALIFGQLLNARRQPAKDAALMVSWQQGPPPAAGAPSSMRSGDIAGGGSAGRRAPSAKSMLGRVIRTTRTDEVGRWKFCVPRRSPAIITVTEADGEWEPLPIEFPPSWKFVRFNLPNTEPHEP